MWPCRTPDADGEMTTYGCECEPVAWQIVTCVWAVSTWALTSAFSSCLASCFTEADTCAVSPHCVPLFFSACTSTSCFEPQFVLCGWLLPGPWSVAVP